jgi:hypothetical protein
VELTAPLRQRPKAPPGYGYATEPEGMLAWERVEEALAGATLYWIGTVAPDGGPHLHSIWGGWVANHLFFEGGDDTRWARNLAADPRVSFGVEANDLHVSGRGRVAKATAGADFPSLVSGYAGKYQYQPQNDDFYRVDPEVVIALDMSSLEAFAVSPTKFRFGT